MPKLLTALAALSLTAVVAGCSSDATKSSSTSVATTVASGDATSSPSTASSADGTGPSTGGSTSESTAGPDSSPSSASTADTVPATTAPPGDGHWHPSLHDSTLPDLSPLALTLFDGLDVTSVGAAAQFYDIRSFAAQVNGACADAQATMAAKAAADGLTVLANGSNATAAWFVAESSIIDGINFSMVPGADDTTCEIDGLPLSPATLTFDGPIQGTITAAAGISCGPGFNGGITLGIWGFPVDPNGGTATVFVSTADNPQPGAHEFVNGGDGGVIGLLTTNGTWTLPQFLAAATNADGGVPAGFTALSGTVTLAEGLASGSLDVTDGSEHITGTFACGTPIVDAPPANVTPTT
ncbi:MAG: hypothetical protein JWN39_2696 [Ilumatobacteraceae bacterium]|nr:hypothetical protein [Ilumatobacteraceae bacterium]